MLCEIAVGCPRQAVRGEGGKQPLHRRPADRVPQEAAAGHRGQHAGTLTAHPQGAAGRDREKAAGDGEQVPGKDTDGAGRSHQGPLVGNQA